jgi:hypothetical protein
MSAPVSESSATFALFTAPLCMSFVLTCPSTIWRERTLLTATASAEPESATNSAMQLTTNDGDGMSLRCDIATPW